MSNSENKSTNFAGDFFVYSTMTNDMNYTMYAPRSDLGGPNVIAYVDGKPAQVLIKGKCNVVDRQHLITPTGMVTKINAKQREILEQIPLFKQHQKAGFLKVEKVHVEPEQVAKKYMQPKDESAPLTPEDYKNSAGPKPQPVAKASS